MHVCHMAPFSTLSKRGKAAKTRFEGELSLWWIVAGVGDGKLTFPLALMYVALCMHSHTLSLLNMSMVMPAGLFSDYVQLCGQLLGLPRQEPF